MHTTRSPAELRNMLGANLRRLSRSYPSISELARQLGINRTQFNRYLSGESFPRPDVLDRICSFFRVDARILLEPVESLNTRGNVLGGNFLQQFHGAGINDIPEEEFPSGFYRFSRRSFMNDDRFVIGLVRVFRSDGVTYLRGMEPRDAVRQQGLPVNHLAREYRGYVAREEDGVAIMVARVQATTCSFSFLARVPAFERNYWLGYVARTMRESATQRRMTRLVYEHLPNKTSDILAAARSCGFCTAEELVPYHRRLLQIDEPFRQVVPGKAHVVSARDDGTRSPLGCCKPGGVHEPHCLRPLRRASADCRSERPVERPLHRPGGSRRRGRRASQGELVGPCRGR